MASNTYALWGGDKDSSTSSWYGIYNKLPSPTEVNKTYELIWDADAGRNAKGKMIATLIAQKMTYEIKWEYITYDDLVKIHDILSPGFFKFGEGTEASPPSSANIFYRSEIAYSVVPVQGNGYGLWGAYYTDVSVSVIEQ